MSAKLITRRIVIDRRIEVGPREYLQGTNLTVRVVTGGSNWINAEFPTGHKAFLVRGTDYVEAL